MPGRYLLTIAEAAEALGLSVSHIKRLIADADANRRSRWRWGRELVDLSPLGSSRRTVRINLAAVVPGLSARGNPAASAADDPHG